MGKGFIQENLGDGHYRVALDIDVSYAREQLAAIQAYLAEFQSAYEEAAERKEEAKAALGPINARLQEYLSAAQTESTMAYDAMLLMASAIMFSTLLGIFLGEWKKTSQRTRSLLAAGLLLLVASSVISGYSGYLKQ